MFRILLLMLMFTVQATSILMPEAWPFSSIRESVRGSLCSIQQTKVKNVISPKELEETVKAMVNKSKTVLQSTVPQQQTTVPQQQATVPQPQQPTVNQGTVTTQ